jgi:hypothetical protein
VALKKGFTYRNILDADSSFSWFELHDAIDEQKRVTVREDLLDIDGFEH